MIIYVCTKIYFNQDEHMHIAGQAFQSDPFVVHKLSCA